MDDELNLKQIAADLKTAGNPWEMDPTNEIALLSDKERKRRLGFSPPPGELQLEEAIELSEVQKDITAEEIASEAAGLPSAYDLRNVNGKKFTTSVKNQGACGSCVAFGACAVLETTCKRTRNAPGLPVNLSEAQLFYCHAAEEGRNCSNGWWPNNAFKKAKDKGVTFDSFFPYTGGDQACNVQSGWKENLAKSTGHTKLGTRTEMKQWIASKGSITGCFVVYQDFFSYRSGIYRHVSGGSAGGHCVEIVGYSDPQRCWICKNSWGKNWGEGGFFRIAYGQCGIETWAGPYGVNGVTLKKWDRNTRVKGLWANRAERNAHVYLSGVGWRKLATSSVTTHHTMLAQLVAAKAANRRVHVLEENNKIKELYVI